MIFISYSSKDFNIANHVRQSLQNRGIDCWMAPESIPGGSDYATEIPIAIDNCDQFLLVLSNNAQNSIYVPKELDIAISKKKNVLPLNLDVTELVPNFRLLLTNVQLIDASGNLGEAIMSVIDRIGNEFTTSGSCVYSTYENDSYVVPMKKLNDARKSYNIQATAQYCEVKTLLFNKQPVPLSKIYTRMALKDADDAFIKTNDVSKLKTQYGNRLLITGGAGSGKSLMLRYMFLKALKNHRQIPVLLFLRYLEYEFVNDGDFLCKQIYKSMYSLGFDTTWDVFKESLQMLPYVIFLDGYDEVEYDTRKNLEYLINDFCKRYPQIIVVVSSRPESSFVSWNNFVELEIRPLTKSLMKIMIERNSAAIGEVKGLVNEIDLLFERKLAYIDLLRTPLLLTIVCMSFGQFGELPEKISLFYDQAFTALYNGQDKTKNGYVRSVESGLSYSEFKRLTEYICFKSYFNYEYSFSERELINYIQIAIDKKIIPQNTQSKEIILSDIVDSIGIFVRDGMNYVLVHRSFQEYFAAVFLENNMNDDMQVQFFSSWLRKKRITASSLFLDILYEYNPDRFIQNIIVPGIDELERKYKESGCSKEYLIELLVEKTYIRNHRSLGLKYPVATINDMYYNHIIIRTCRIGIEGSVFTSRSSRVLGLDNEKLQELAKKSEVFVSAMISRYGYNRRVPINELKQIGLYEEFIDSCYWIFERYEFAVQFVKEFKEKRSKNNNTYQSIIDMF